ncbi:hypothetical protein Vadar_006054 [Vaccinium darrowii]|uniref:Uncharacterized protein n=1 Tax=Vaccinium darrowii TaxID=229202 RepID=A0ACB7XNZ3_9ERIC|nr:hypothetical protein Vadar_006054 [Vaccinium darrowii]
MATRFYLAICPAVGCSAEVDPIPLLPKVVSLLYIQVHNKALQAPGRAISVAVSRLKSEWYELSFRSQAKYNSEPHCATIAQSGEQQDQSGEQQQAESGEFQRATVCRSRAAKV